MKEQSNIVYKYVCSTSGNSFTKVDFKSFNGFEIKYYNNRVNSIRILQELKLTSVITFRPTSTPLIASVQCTNGYFHDRYNNNNIRSEYYYTNGSANGEYLSYFADHFTVNKRAFMKEGSFITNEVTSLVGWTGSNIEWTHRKFNEAEMFNLVMRYGNDFKFYDEFREESTKFDYIANYCLNK